MAMLFVLAFAIGGIACSFAEPVVVWNMKVNSNNVDSLTQLLDIPTVDHPLVVLAKDMFDLGEFSRAGDVYSANSDGGKLKHLKKWMKESKGYSVLYRPQNAMRQIETDIALKLNPETVLLIPDIESFDQTKLNGAALIIVEIARAVEELDVVAEKLSKALGKRDYTAVLVGRYPEVTHNLRKRAAATAAPSTRERPGVYVNISECIFFYTKKFEIVAMVKDKDNKRTTYSVPINATDLKFDGGCSEAGAWLKLNFAGPTVGHDNLKINRVLLSLTFNHTFASNRSDWRLSDALVEDIGGTIDGKEFDYKSANVCSTTNVRAIADFSFSCEKPSIFWIGANVAAKPFYCSPAARLAEEGHSVGIRFFGLQVQPFPRSSGKFGDAFDCEGFFSIGIWMGLFSGLILILIFSYGIIMITQLKTMDRFDDPKGKPMLINVKE